MLLSWATLLFSTHTITITREEYSRASRWLGVRRKITYIQNGIDAPLFADATSARTYLAQRIGKPEHFFDQKTLVGTIGELTPNKGILDILDTIKNLPITYIVIGTGELHNTITEYVRKNGLHEKVFLTGFIQHASQYLTAFDTFLLPSKKEGLPYVLIEAGFAKVPVVARNVGGIPDLIRHEENGILFSENADIPSSLALSKRIHGERLYLTVAEHNTKEKMCSLTRALY